MSEDQRLDYERVSEDHYETWKLWVKMCRVFTVVLSLILFGLLMLYLN
jgi:hypothetical protein